MHNNGIDFFDRSNVVVTGNQIQVNLPKDYDKSDLAPILSDFLNVANRFEGFAVLFISGVADEEIAYTSVGRTYCQSMNNILPLVLAAGGGKHYLTNSVKLFLLWNARLEAESLDQKKQAIDERLKSINHKTITPIGTK